MLQHANAVRMFQASDNKETAFSVPLDIWVEIASSMNDIRQVVKLLAICQQVRSALLQCKHLWAELDFDNQDQPFKRKSTVWKKKLACGKQYGASMRVGHPVFICNKRVDCVAA